MPLGSAERICTFAPRLVNSFSAVTEEEPVPTESKTKQETEVIEDTQTE